MAFRLTDSQLTYQRQVRQLIQGKIAPQVPEIETGTAYPWGPVKEMARFGLFSLPVPKSYGGQGEGSTTLCIVGEEIGKVCVALGGILLSTWVPEISLLSVANEEQKNKYLPSLARGEKAASFGLTEYGAGSDVGGMHTTAVQDGKDYVLNGCKRFAANLTVADVYVIFAKTDQDKGARGISAFIIDKGAQGLNIGKLERKMGWTGSVHGEVILDNCRVSADNIFGQLNQGMKVALSSLDVARIVFGAVLTGLAQAALDDSLAYGRKHKQFGRPIIENQVIQFMLADMATEVNASRLLTFQAAALKDEGQGIVSKEAAMAKLYASEMAVRVAHRAVQIHGGNGYTKDYAVERYMRDAIAGTLAEGTSEIQRIVISRALLKP